MKSKLELKQCRYQPGEPLLVVCDRWLVMLLCLLLPGTCVAQSYQVLHEFYANASRKIRLDPATARKTVEVLSKWKPVEPGLGLIERGWRWMDQSQIGFWDSLIVAAAERAGCRWLLSEDFQAGRRFDTVTVVNPFTHAPDEYGLLQGRPRSRES